MIEVCPIVPLIFSSRKHFYNFRFALFKSLQAFGYLIVFKLQLHLSFPVKRWILLATELISQLHYQEFVFCVCVCVRIATLHLSRTVKQQVYWSITLLLCRVTLLLTTEEWHSVIKFQVLDLVWNELWASLSKQFLWVLSNITSGKKIRFLFSFGKRCKKPL